MLADRVKCDVPAPPGPVGVGSTVTLGPKRPNFSSFLEAFGGGNPAYFVLSDGAGRTITGVWTVNAAVPETATITQIIWNDRTRDTSGETFSGALVAWNEVPARETLTLRGGAMTGNLDVPSLNGGPLAGLRNLVINGDFRVNQRGYVSGTIVGGGAYTLDRWRLIAGGSVTYATSGTGRLITIPAGVYYEQIVEAVFAGQYTLSWAGTATGILNNATVVPNGGSVTVPDGNHSLSFSDGTLGRVQFEPGPLATPFERRQIALEETLCRRFFRRLGHDCPVRATLGVGTATYLPIGFDPPMRASPTPTPAWTGASGAVSTYAINRITTHGATVELTTVGGGDVFITLQAATTFNAEF